MSSPSNPEVEVHCRRTEAVAKLMAHHLFLPSEEKDLLCAACLRHHNGTGLLEPQSMQRLLTDVWSEAPALLMDDAIPVPTAIRNVLNAYNVPGSGEARNSSLAAILRLADAFDQDMEAQPIDGADVGGILERLRCGVAGGLWPQAVMDALADSTLPQSRGQKETWRVPVFPQAALNMLSLMRDPRVSIALVVQAARLDPATAGLVMQLANSALFGSRGETSTIAGAIARLGFATAQKLIMSSALRGVFGSPKLQEVWQHSLHVADLSEQLARATGGIDPAAAYLAGLVHDVGQLVVLSVPLYDSARLHGLERGGCRPVYAESLLLRTDHAAIGARIAAGWGLPETMVAAIRQHHRPEETGNPLAHLLYLAEHLSGSDEDLPSLVRLEASLRALGLKLGDIDGYTVSALGCWLAVA
ncbi:MAG: HDOD domain-containing protein [Candidatus Solibacter sp.]